MAGSCKYGDEPAGSGATELGNCRCTNLLKLLQKI
jgi:hypothetical protein